MLFSNSDGQFILKWAKKVKAINLLGGKCQRCKSNNIFVLTFHHKDNGDKVDDMAYLLSMRWSRVIKELEKCELLCYNCHMELHSETKPIDRRMMNLKIDLLKYKGVKECQVCGYVGKNHRSLDFHHRDASKKVFGICKEVNKRKIILDYIKDELDKCDVLCANCHCLKHIDISRFNKLKSEIYLKIENYKETHLPLSIKEVIKMYRSGTRQIEISRIFGCHKTTISLIIKKYNL